MFKTIFKRVFALISQPLKEWEAIAEEKQEHDKFLSNFLYPLIGFVVFAVFIGALITRKDFNAEMALKLTVRSIVSSFGGFFLGSYILNEVWSNVFKKEKDMKMCQYFVGYSSVLMFVLSIVLALFPEFFFLQIFLLYTVYIVWEGAEIYMHIEDNRRMSFVVYASAIIVLTPVVIEIVLGFLMPGLRV